MTGGRLSIEVGDQANVIEIHMLEDEQYKRMVRDTSLSKVLQYPL